MVESNYGVATMGERKVGLNSPGAQMGTRLLGVRNDINLSGQRLTQRISLFFNDAVL